jgi:polyisoprenoid-binding protein YceI
MVRVTRLVVAVALATLLAVAALAGWALWPREAPPSPTATQAAAVLARIDPGPSATTSTGAPPADDAEPAATTAAPAPFAGTWTLVADAPSSLGYRVEQILAGQGVSTVVGNTPGLQASLTVEGTTLTTGSLTADLSQLASDQVLRDRTLREAGLETNVYPSARFELTRPLDLAGLVAGGPVLRLVAEGNLELHGVTRPVSVPVDVQAGTGAVAITGAFQIALADFAIDKPHVSAVLSIGDTGIVEFQLYLSRA